MTGMHPYQARPEAGSHEWLTPPEIIRALGSFDLDPCAPAVRPWPTARDHISLPTDGLAAEWRGRVWLNPPYGSHTSAWLRRLAEHGDGIALVFVRTETEMFQRWVWPRADALLFMARRPHFHYVDGSRAKGNSGGPMVLIAYGQHNVAALRRSGIPGALVMTVATTLPSEDQAA
jgi:hypothetical protein